MSRPTTGTRNPVTWLGTPVFPKAARTALADAQARRNIRKATSTIRAKRAAVIAEHDDWQLLRAAGAAIKNDVLAHLDEYLLRLERSVTERGGIGHTEQFLTVKLAAPIVPGTILDLHMAGHDGRRLLAA